MNNATPLAARPSRSRFPPIAAVLLAILAGQFALYGPSLVGNKVLLPLDILGQRNYYLPHSSGLANAVPDNFVLSDLVLHAEPTRVFAARELRAGRFPLWNPHAYAGAPHVLMRFSPFMLLRTLTESPLILPWIPVLVALIAGLGIYAFCRKALTLAIWPAGIAACCYPLNAYFVFWQGYGHTYSLAWLPWLLLAQDRAIRGKHKAAGMAVALLAWLLVVSGPLDTAAQELLVAGFHAAWIFFSAHGRRWASRRSLRAGVLLVVAWGTGLLLAAPEILSTAAYAKTGARMIRRAQGEIERPPAGLAALPLLVLPNLDGTTERQGVSIAPRGHRNQMEGVPMSYAGVLATLLFAPLAWQSRRHRYAAIGFTGLGVLGLGWSLNLPGIAWFMRLPGMNMMSHNRLLFATSLAITVMAAIGLDAVVQARFRWRAWHWAPLVLAVGLCLLGAARVGLLPSSLDARLDTALRELQQVGMVRDAAGVEQAKSGFRYGNSIGAVLCGLTAMTWLLLRRKGAPPRWAMPILGAIMAADLLWFAHGWNTQSDPTLYYPRIPVLEQIARSTSGRVVGFDCLPADLAQIHGLRDIRGYDAVDPRRFVSLLEPAADAASTPLPYAALQLFSPRLRFESPTSVRLPPALDMLGVEAVIFRGEPPSGLQPAFAGGDYWAMTNPRALPRVFVPRRVEYAPAPKERLAKLSAASFDGREVAYVEEPVALPLESRGQVTITRELPTRITLSASMETAGLVVLTDLFDAGWQAFRAGKPTPILRVNHAVRGVSLPAGESVVEFRYWPAGFTTGFRLAGLGLLILLGWSASLLWRRRTTC